MTVTFGRPEIVRVLATNYGVFDAHVRRNLVPTLIGDPGRMLMTAFDALMTAATDSFCRDGGMDRGAVAAALHHSQEHFLGLARALDGGEQNLCAIIALRADGKVGAQGGPFHLVIDAINRSRPPVIRVTYINLNATAWLVRENAKAASVDIGDQFGLSGEELAEVAANPFRRRQKPRKSPELRADA